ERGGVGGALGVSPGEEWAGFARGTAEAELIARSPRPTAPAPISMPETPEDLGESYPSPSSTQEAFGRILGRLGRLPIGDRIVTLSADVAVTTHLAAWITRKGGYFPRANPDPFAGIPPAVQSAAPP